MFIYRGGVRLCFCFAIFFSAQFSSTSLSTRSERRWSDLQTLASGLSSPPFSSSCIIIGLIMIIASLARGEKFRNAACDMPSRYLLHTPHPCSVFAYNSVNLVNSVNSVMLPLPFTSAFFASNFLASHARTRQSLRTAAGRRPPLRQVAGQRRLPRQPQVGPSRPTPSSCRRPTSRAS